MSDERSMETPSDTEKLFQPKTVTETLRYKRDPHQRRCDLWEAAVRDTLAAIEMLARQGARHIHIIGTGEEKGDAWVTLEGELGA